ncbi:DUF21 domain-containing protein [Mangrovivirga cuniculi]|uniref:DUF21 domain-containing protein n=1 Tax=Mangrovivirga cuniculi TaxID=2715131 RepID=UPI001FE6396D|nr:DUF21 domain-containing protein [Mangrovivirga cuniculi]
MFLLFFYLALALGFSFLCSILEAALLSITPVFVKAKEQEGAAYAKELKLLKENVDKPLAAILSLNTIAHTIGAAGVGAQASIVFGEAYFGIISAILTVLILIFSEIIPKSLGAKYWKSLAPFVSRTLKILVVLMFPLVWISERITRLMGEEAMWQLREEKILLQWQSLVQKQGYSIKVNLILLITLSDLNQ